MFTRFAGGQHCHLTASLRSVAKPRSFLWPWCIWGGSVQVAVDPPGSVGSLNGLLGLSSWCWGVGDQQAVGMGLCRAASSWWADVRPSAVSSCCWQTAWYMCRGQRGLAALVTHHILYINRPWRGSYRKAGWETRWPFLLPPNFIAQYMGTWLNQKHLTLVVPSLCVDAATLVPQAPACCCLRLRMVWLHPVLM